jgi:hypothetical protein
VPGAGRDSGTVEGPRPEHRKPDPAVLPSIGPVDELLDERRELDRKLTLRLREQVAGSRLRAAVCGLVLGQQRNSASRTSSRRYGLPCSLSFLMSSRLWAFAKATRSAWTFLTPRLPFNSTFTRCTAPSSGR